MVTTRLLNEELSRAEGLKGPSLQQETALFGRQKGAAQQSVASPGRAQLQSRSRTNDICNYCKQRGHWRRDCNQRKADYRRDGISSNSVDLESQAFVTALSAQVDTEAWIMDSGASMHLTYRKDWIDDFKEISPVKIYLGDDSVREARGNGIVHLELVDGTRTGHLTDVLYVPGLTKNLFSISKATEQGLEAVFSKTSCLLTTDKGVVKAQGVRTGNLYHLKCKVARARSSGLLTQHEKKFEVWHRRLGHLNAEHLQLLHREKLVNGLDLGSSGSLHFCKGCVLGKQQRLAFPSDGARRATVTLELVHADVWGPTRTTSVGGARYFVSFIDDYSRKVFVYFMRQKSEVFTKFREFKALAETTSRNKLRGIRSDNGGEFIQGAFEEYLKEHGILHQTSSPYSPQQNGVAERMNRTLVEMARSMLQDQELGKELWAEAVATAAYLRARCPTKAVSHMTPEEAWSGQKPSISHLKIFGCEAYVLKTESSRSKLDAKSKRCTFVGYSQQSKAHRLWDNDARRIVISRDVVFNEEATPASEHVPTIKFPDVAKEPLRETDIEEAEHKESHVPEDVEDDEVEPEDVADLPNHEEQPAPQRRYPGRERKKPQRFDKSGLYACLASVDEPASIEDALLSPEALQWEQAAQDEYKSILANRTWTLTKLPPGRKAIGCKWIFRVKRKANGDIDRYKARLVAKGFAQKEGLDFKETFAPVAKFESIRCLLAIGAVLDLEIHQMDVMTAFLNGELEEEVYMTQPEGFITKGKEDYVCKLNRALYGLKQAPRVWNLRIDKYLQKQEFTRCESDHSIYVLDGGRIILAIYVDDLIIMGKHLKDVLNVKASLSDEFEMKDMGELEYCLGIQVVRDRQNRSITLGQGKYVQDILHQFGMDQCKPLSTPIDVNHKLSAEACPKTEEERQRCQRYLIGKR